MSECRRQQWQALRDYGKCLIYVHNMDGDVAQKLYDNTSDKLTVYKCAVSDDGGNIYVTDRSHNRIISLDNQGNQLVATLTDDVIQRPAGVHVTPYGHVFVVCFENRRILQISQDGGSVLTSLAQNVHAVNGPRCVLFHQLNERLLVC